MSETVKIEKTPEPDAEQVGKTEETPTEVEVLPPNPYSDPVRFSNTLPIKSFGERAYPFLVAVSALFAVVAVVLGVLWHGASSDYDALKSAQSDRDRAAQVAKDYTLRSLTYDYRNLPAFFDGVQRGTSDALRDRYSQVHDTLAKIMTDAQVVATGDVVGTSVEAKGNDQYTVTVYATQKTQNVQQPDPATVPNLLVLTVAKSGGDWLVTDYGPKDVGAKGGAAK